MNTEIEKIKRGLECMCEENHKSCSGCGYSHNPNCFYAVVNDALALLKYQAEEIKNLMTALENVSTMGKDC